MDYNGKLILAPMVRVGTHPMRLVAAGYGADIVYSEELVDKRVIASVRRVNEALGTVDFLDKGGGGGGGGEPNGCGAAAGGSGGRVMFRTTSDEKPRLVFQLGTADGVSALAAASVVAGDVGCVDVNMGCPKQFSLQGGMGAALLRKPEVAEDILRTLRRNLQLPVSCKIRLLDDPRDTVELARRLAACGISALAVHGRTQQQRPRDPADWGRIRLVVDAMAGSVPVIANGDVMSYEDAVRVRQETGCAAAMVARAAMWNASVFRPQGFLPLEAVQREYVRLAVRWGNALPNTKYCLKEMADAPVSFAGRAGGCGALVGHKANTAITRARDEGQLCRLVGIAGEQPYQDLEIPAPSLLPNPKSTHTKGVAKTGSARGNGGRRNGGGGGEGADGPPKKRARNSAIVGMQPETDLPPPSAAAAATATAVHGEQQPNPQTAHGGQQPADVAGEVMGDGRVDDGPVGGACAEGGAAGERCVAGRRGNDSSGSGGAEGGRVAVQENDGGRGLVTCGGGGDGGRATGAVPTAVSEGSGADAAYVERLRRQSGDTPAAVP